MKQVNTHLSRLVHDVAAQLGNREALIYKDFGSKEWKSYSWNDFSRRVKLVSNALLNLGVGVQENLGVFSQNTVQYLFTDFGAWGIRAVTIPFYATSSEQQIQFMIHDARIRFLFVGEQAQYDKAWRVFATCQSLERIIAFDPAVVFAPGDTTSMHFTDFLKLGKGLPRQSEVDNLTAQATMDDTANILYTSGTTGDSKGVVLSCGQYHAAMEANHKCVPVTSDDRVLNFLPFTHIFEKGWKILCITVGARLIVNTNPMEVQQSMRETHPTCMSAVPRFWEKVYMGVNEKIESSGAVKRRLFEHALKVGYRHNIEYLSRGKRPPMALRMEYEMLNKTVFSLVRRELGLENERKLEEWFMVAMSRHVLEAGRTPVSWCTKAVMPEGHLLQAWNDVHEIMDLAWSGRPNDVISSLYIPFYMDYPQSFEEPHYYWMTVQTEEAMYDGEPAAHMEREIGDRLKGIESPLWTEMVPEWRVKAKFLPRAIAIAEVGWTQLALRDYQDYRRRRRSLTAAGYTW